MPYYREIFVNSKRGTSARNTTLKETSTSTVVLDSAVVMSYRSRPHPKALHTERILDNAADPYAWFLTRQSSRKYRALLEERGLPPEGEADRGHAFQMYRRTVKTPTFQYAGPSLNQTTDVNGVLWWDTDYPREGSNLLGKSMPTSISPLSYNYPGLDTFAQHAFARAAPTPAVFDAALFLGELKDGLPRLVPDLVKGSANFFRNLGSDYLNVQFGWKPFISDLQNAARALLGATEQLTKNGKRVSGRYGAPPELTSKTHRISARPVFGSRGGTGVMDSKQFRELVDPNLGLSLAQGRHPLSLTESVYRKRWFEGEFSNFYPLGFDPDDFVSRAKVLIDVSITPTLLWELAPWSWLIDWGLRLGDSIEANEKASNDLLVMHYGYAMETYRYVIDGYWTLDPGTSFYRGFPAARKGSFMDIHTFKRRLRANPYGFKVTTPRSLSGDQWAILGALGLTKFR